MGDWRKEIGGWLRTQWRLSILVPAGDKVGKYRERNRREAGEAGERMLLLQGGGPLLLLDVLDGAAGGQDVAGLGLFAAGDGNG